VEKALGTVALLGGANAAALVESLSPMVKYLIGDIRHMSMSVSGLPPDQDGMIGVTVLLTTEGKSAKVCSTMSEMVAGMVKVFADNEEAREWVSLFEYKAGAETSGSVKVDHFTIKLPSEVDGEDREKANKIIGKEGILLRVAAVTDQRVAITFGGGSERLAQVVKAAQTDAAPLASDEGIQRVSAFLPKKRSAEGYLAVDRLLTMIGEIAKVAGKPLGVTMPEINAPIAFVTAPAGKAGSQNDVFVPLEAIVAVKDAVINAMGQKMNPAAQTEGDL
jgi:hypothetical protein